MLEPKQGMFFRGADNKGKCLEVDLDEDVDQTYEDYIKKFLRAGTTEDVRYLPEYTEDPMFTFEDSIIYGCHLDLNFLELKDYCSNTRYRNLLLFQYLNQTLNYIGKFGNSNPHFVSDWIKVQNEEIFGLND